MICVTTLREIELRKEAMRLSVQRLICIHNAAPIPDVDALLSSGELDAN